MFDKALFYSLCEKYQVELSNKYDRPMIKDGEDIHAITVDDVKRVFSNCQLYFNYGDSKIVAKNTSVAFNDEDDLAIAC